MKKIFTSLSIFAFIILFVSCGEKETQGYQTYENDNEGFTISYPENWNYKEGFAKDSKLATGSIVVFQNPSEGKRDLFQENVHIFTEPLPDSVKNIDQYFEYSQSYLPAQLKDIEFVEKGKIVIDGVNAKWMIFTYANRLQKVNSIGYIFYRDGHGLVITGTARPEDFMRFRRTFENIATSIKFK